jgi:WS/DGAT/MGAT family acyltransferase
MQALPAVRLPRPKRRGLLAPVLRPVRGVVRGVGKAAGAVLSEGATVVTNPGHIFKRAKQGLDYTASLSRLALRGSDSDTRFKGPLGLRKRAAWSEAIPLEEVKAVANAEGATINDALTATLAGALRSYLVAQGDAVDGVEMRAVIPVNLRDADRAHELGNEFGLVFLALPVFIEDPVERLHETCRRMDKLKNSMEAVAAYTILNVVGVSPGGVRDQIIGMFSAMASTVLTNVPGPRETLYIAGAPLENIMFWVPRAGSISTGLSILSYDGKVTVGIASDAALIPDPSAIAAAYHDEFEKLKAAVLEKGREP